MSGGSWWATGPGRGRWQACSDRGGLVPLLLLLGTVAAASGAAAILATLAPVLLTVAAAAVVLGIVGVIALGVWRYRDVHGPRHREPEAVPAPVPVRVRPAWPHRVPSGGTVEQAKEA